MIEKLEWDSLFFGFPVGQLIVKKFTQNEILEFINQARNFKLVYIITNEEIKPEINKLKLVDIKTRLGKEVGNQNNEDEMVKEYKGGQDNQLKKLALQSGIYSRFNTDANFVNKEYEKLYLEWISGSIKKTIADKVLVYCDDGNLCKGFVTLKFKKKFSEIGLIAVDAESRGKGIAKALLSNVDYCTAKVGLHKIEVVTQFDNLPAMKLYEKAGYKILSKKYIYHLWG